MTVITLLTDFGLKDGYPGIMKGIIWSIAPHVQVADITHLIPPQDIFQGALALSRAVAFFPPATIHVAVVDPGVGTSRRPIAMRIGEHYFVGPDNGLFTFVLEGYGSKTGAFDAFHLDQPGYWLPEISQVFQGRDIFAPIAAHIANGVRLTSLGSPIADPIRLEIPKPQKTSTGWIGQVIHVDHFGNLATNLNHAHLQGKGEVSAMIKGVQISGVVTTFGARPPGSLVALIDSSGYLTISVVNSSAEQQLHASVGDQVELNYFAG